MDIQGLRLTLKTNLEFAEERGSKAFEWMRRNMNNERADMLRRLNFGSLYDEANYYLIEAKVYKEILALVDTLIESDAGK